MARLAIALDGATEDRILADIVEHGHTIVARLASWRAVLENLDVLGPDVAVVGAARTTLSAELLAGCDERGIRLIALAASDAERADATRLGLHEVIDHAAPWTEIEPLVSGECRCRRAWAICSRGRSARHPSSPSGGRAERPAAAPSP